MSLLDAKKEEVRELARPNQSFLEEHTIALQPHDTYLINKLYGRSYNNDAMVEFELPENGIATEQVTAILKAISTAQLDQNTGCQMLNAMVKY